MIAIQQHNANNSYQNIGPHIDPAGQTGVMETCHMSVLVICCFSMLVLLQTTILSEITVITDMVPGQQVQVGQYLSDIHMKSLLV